MNRTKTVILLAVSIVGTFIVYFLLSLITDTIILTPKIAAGILVFVSLWIVVFFSLLLLWHKYDFGG